MIQDLIHRQIIEHRDQVDQWFSQKSVGLTFPVTSSFDIRDSHFKVSTVDANLFPAGFNNICQVDKESAVELMGQYLDQYYGPKARKILLLTEEHTKNVFYWENVRSLMDVISGSEREVILGIPREFSSPLSVESAFGHKLTVFSAQREGPSVVVNGVTPDVIISNNDFSTAYEGWAEGLDISVNPPVRLGWHQRKKNTYFEIYNHLAEEFARVIEVDPWRLQIRTELFTPFDLGREESSDELAKVVDKFIHEIQGKYQEFDIQEPPFVFIKNNSGTYGLGVTRVESGDEVRSWNYKARKKMKATKGGGGISEVIVQEGIPSAIRSGADEVAEPAIYMIGQGLAGGFIRAHGKKGPTESLNSPGAVFRRLCISDLAIDIEGLPMENVYGWLAKIGTLALGEEAKLLGTGFGPDFDLEIKVQ